MSITAIELTARLADVADVPASATCLSDSNAATPLELEMLGRLVARKHLWVVELGDEGIVGTLGFDDSVCRGSLFVHMMGVRPGYRRHGIATALFRHAAEFARAQGFRRMIADVPSHNTGIAAALSAWGFERMGAVRRGRRGVASQFWVFRV